MRETFYHFKESDGKGHIYTTFCYDVKSVTKYGIEGLLFTLREKGNSSWHPVSILTMVHEVPIKADK